MTVSLPRDLMIRLYARLREAERSLDVSLWTSWEEFRGYYDDRRQAALRALVQDLQDRLPTKPGLVNRDELLRRLRRPSLLGACRGWLARWQGSWKVGSDELGFMATRLQDVLALLPAPSKPTDESLVGLRLDLSVCQSVLAARAWMLPALRRADREMEHLNRAEWLPTTTEAELLGLPQGGAAANRGKASVSDLSPRKPI